MLGRRASRHNLSAPPATCDRHLVPRRKSRAVQNVERLDAALQILGFVRDTLNDAEMSATVVAVVAALHELRAEIPPRRRGRRVGRQRTIDEISVSIEQ